MHDDAGGAVRAGELVCRALGVRAARVHRRGLVVIGSADAPHASATGHNMHAPLVIRVFRRAAMAAPIPRVPPLTSARFPVRPSVWMGDAVFTVR